MLRSVFCYFLLLSTVASHGNDSLPKSPFVIRPLKQTMVFDGMPDESFWRDAGSLSFHVLEPVWGTTPNEKTEMRFLFDAHYLYVAGRCYYKDPSKIIVRNFVRDGWRGDDWVAVHIDSRFDHQTAINFAIYPAGSRYDMLISNDAVELGGSPTNPSFNAVWNAKSVITKEGWFFEMKIPLYNLRYSVAADGSVQMALSVTRWTAYNNELQHSVAIPQGLSSGFLRPSQKQEVRFEGLKKHKLMLLTPYVAASSEHRNVYNQASRTVVSDRTNRITAGLDAKFGITQRLTLDATINPDFGQAEADVQQLNLTRFGLYLPERRLFFQEQSGLFDFSLGNTAQLFYSRRIGLAPEGVVPLFGGLRLTGQLTKSLDVGVLNMQSISKSFSDQQKYPSENVGVLRLRQKVMNERSFIGLLATNRNSGRTGNYSIGADALLNVFANHYLKIGLAATQTREPKQKHPFGLGSTRLSVAWENLEQKGFIPKFSYTYSGKNFNPSLGFLDRANFHNLRGELSYGVFATRSTQYFSQQKYSLFGSVYTNGSDGKMESLLSGLKWVGYTRIGGGVAANAEYNAEYISDSLVLQKDLIIQSGRYQFPSFSILLTPPDARKISFPIGIGAGGFFGGEKYFLSISPNINSARTFQIQPGYDFTYLHFGKNQSNKNSKVHIARLKILYAPNLHFSAAANFQYNSLEKKFFSNVRVRYNFQDGHDIYLVWNNDSRMNRLINGTKLDLVEQQMLMLKYTYLFNLVKASTKS